MRFLQAFARHIYGVRCRAENRNIYLLGKCLQLFNSGRTLQVGSNEQRVSSLGFKPSSQFRRRRGFPGTLQASHKNNGRRFLRIRNLKGLSAQDCRQFLVDHLHDLLSGSQTLRDFAIKASGLGPLHKTFYDVEVNVGF